MQKPPPLLKRAEASIMFEHQNESSSWNFRKQSSDSQNNAVYAEVHNAMNDPDVWHSVRLSMDAGQVQSLNGFPSSDVLLADAKDVNVPSDIGHGRVSDCKDNFLETAIKAPALLLDTWKEISGIKMTEQMVLAVLQNPEAMKLAVIAVQTGTFA